MIFPLKQVIFRFHVSFWGCRGNPTENLSHFSKGSDERSYPLVSISTFLGLRTNFSRRISFWGPKVQKCMDFLLFRLEKNKGDF